NDRHRRPPRGEIERRREDAVRGVAVEPAEEQVVRFKLGKLQCFVARIGVAYPDDLLVAECLEGRAEVFAAGIDVYPVGFSAGRDTRVVMNECGDAASL